MKSSLATILLSFFSLMLCAQKKDTVNNFSINEDQKIVWQKVFLNSVISFEDIVSHVKSNDAFSDIDIKENRITFWNKGFETNPKAVGFGRMTTSFYALSNQKAFFSIDYKPEKYRITAINLSNFPPSINLLNSKVDNHQTPLEDVVLQGNSFKSEFIKKGSFVIDNAIQTLFKFSKAHDKNW